MIYDRPTKTIMKQFAEENLAKGQIFSKQMVVDWFKKKYPNTNPHTVEMHVEGMAVNNIPRRKNHKNIKPGSEHDMFYKIGKDQFRLWEKGTDSKPFYPGDEKSQTLETEVIPADNDNAGADSEAASSQFAFENDLKNYLSKNLEALEKGLRLYQDEGFDGREFPAGDGRRIDILAVNANDEFVVIELKVSRGYDRVIGQILRYMGWIEKNLAAGKKVHGIIVASEITEDLKLATSRIQGVKLVEYEIQFKLKHL